MSKPTFTDQPVRCTRTPRLDQSMAEYASSIERKRTSEPRGWWFAIIVLAIVAAYFVVVQS